MDLNTCGNLGTDKGIFQNSSAKEEYSVYGIEICW